MSCLLVTQGTSLIVLGLVWAWVRRPPLFRLPGDIVQQAATDARTAPAAGMLREDCRRGGLRRRPLIP